MSDAKVIPMKGHRQQSDKDCAEIVSRLEEALAFARNGHCKSLALILLDDEGHALDCFHNGGQPYVMVGAIEALKLDFILANIDQR